MHRRDLHHFRHGAALVYLTVGLTVLIGFAALAVDFAHVQLAKTQAQTAADSAALHAANGIVNCSPTVVQNRAVAAAADNKVDNTSVVVDPNQDVTFGIWDPASKTFTALSGASASAATAIKVTVNRVKSRNTSVPLSFASVLGFSTKDVTATAIASIGTVTSSTVPAMACPWLAGMPNGSYVQNTNGNPTPATAPPMLPTYFPATAGTTLRFTSTTGSTSWDSTSGNGGRDSATADGDPTFIAAQAPANGINTTYAPLNAMMGIFLDDNQPNTTAMAATLDFSTANSRDFSSLSPQLKQVFYIGDGLNSSGQLQSFVAPAGATRLYIGTMDMYGWWWDNSGTIQFIAVQGKSAVLVK